MDVAAVEEEGVGEAGLLDRGGRPAERRATSIRCLAAASASMSFDKMWIG